MLRTDHVIGELGETTVINGIAAEVNQNTPPGALLMWAGAAAPTGWLLADGSAVSRTTYANLFAAIGTTYGAGDGSTTFNLPNFDFRLPRGNTRAASGGADTHTHGGSTSADSAGTPAGTNSIETGTHTHDVGATVFAVSVGTHNHGSPTGLGGGANGGAPSATVQVQGTGTALQSVAGPNHVHGGASHDHSIGSDGNHGHTLTGSTGTQAGAHSHNFTGTAMAAHGHSVGTGSASNVPAYVGVLFIIKV